MKNSIFYLLIFCACLSCKNETKKEVFPLPKEDPTIQVNQKDSLTISQSVFHDKILGLLVGSAIGDAIGSPVEMWSEEQIFERYGFVEDLILNARVASPEGVWKAYMTAGTSTDDTRWKFLMGNFLLEFDENGAPFEDQFAAFLIEQFDLLKNNLIDNDGFEANNLEANTRYLQWFQEWVKVSEAWLSDDTKEYSTALAKFYGGEMSCAGMLYAPMIGILHAQHPELAYEAAWDASLFDLGYAKDITALVAAITANSFNEKFETDSLWRFQYEIDNQSYADSRLIGRIANSIMEDAIYNYKNALKVKVEDEEIELPPYFGLDTLKYLRLQSMYKGMVPKLKDISFHANEIYRISLNSLFFAQGNFKDAMVFLTNFGRDNDTVGAVVGAILGAQIGFEKLPEDWKMKVLSANKEQLNIDLEKLANQLSQKLYN